MAIKSIVKLFRSVRFTVVLLVLLVIVFLLGQLIPQKELLGRDLYINWKYANPELVAFFEFLRLTDIYTSPLTLIIWVLFFINLLSVMLGRIPVIWKRYVKKEIPQNIASIESMKCHGSFESQNHDEIIKVLRQKGYQVFSKEKAFSAVKNRFSPLATILFHFSFLLLLIGGIMTFYTKFRAETNLAVGETFEGQYQWTRMPKIGNVPQAAFTVKDIKPVYYQKEVPLSLKIVLGTKDGDREMGINRPYKHGGLSFIVRSIDVAPLFIIRDEQDREVDSAVVKLKVIDGREDSFRMMDYEFRTFFYTNAGAETSGKVVGKEQLPQILKQSPLKSGRTQQREITDPAFRMGIFKDGKLIRAGSFRMNESLLFDSYSIFFADYTYWAAFYVSSESGLSIIYAGFIFILASLMIRFLFYKREIRGIAERGTLFIGGEGEFFPTIFEDEFSDILHASGLRKR